MQFPYREGHEGTDRPWNLYYGDEALRLRLEAILDFWCWSQHTDGRFSEYKPQGWNLLATGFGVMFMGETLRLLHSGPPIDQALHDRVIAAQRKACYAILTQKALFDQGRSCSNQYSGLWGGLLAFLDVHPDPELESMIKPRLKESLEHHQSPAGYWYEAGGCDWAYTLRTHAGNHLMAWHYARDTDLAPLFTLGEQRWAEWVAYNTAVELDGRTVFRNRAIETRTNKQFNARHNPLSEVAPLGRAFAETQAEVERQYDEQRKKLETDWPNVPDLEVGQDHAYSPHPILNPAHRRWHPTEAQRNEARQDLPYLAEADFNHQRVDRGLAQVFTYVRRPAYYAAFNAGRKLSGQQRFGLGLIWSDSYGTVLQSQTGFKTHASGTRAPDANRVYEEEMKQAIWQVADTAVTPEPGNRDLPPGDLTVTYRLGEVGKKTVTFSANRITVTTSGYLEEADIVFVFTPDSPQIQEGFPLITDREIDDLTAFVADGKSLLLMVNSHHATEKFEQLQLAKLFAVFGLGWNQDDTKYVDITIGPYYPYFYDIDTFHYGAGCTLRYLEGSKAVTLLNVHGDTGHEQIRGPGIACVRVVAGNGCSRAVLRPAVPRRRSSPAVRHHTGWSQIPHDINILRFPWLRTMKRLTNREWAARRTSQSIAACGVLQVALKTERVKQHGMLTDQYMRFWNIPARSLKERFPERQVSFGARAGGVWGLPEVAMRKTMEGFQRDKHVHSF